MLIFQELPTAFPFYDLKEKQVRFNFNSDEPCGASLITPKDALLPFQIRKAVTSELPSLIEILKAEDDSLVEDISSIIPMMKATSRGGYDYLTYLGDRIPAGAAFLDLPTGEYYVKMTFADSTILYSETFLVPLERFGVNDLTACKFLKLEWSNPADISPIHYASVEADRLINRLYLDSIISHTEPEIEQEGTRNGNNELIPSFQKVSINYRITDVVPDFVKLALAVMPIHEEIVLTTEYNKRSGRMVNVSMDSKPAEGGYFSDVDILFEQELAIIRRGCDDNMAPAVCPPLPADINLNITSGATGFTVFADIPLGMFAEVGTSYELGPATVVAARVYRAELLAGFFVPYSVATGDIFHITLKTFGCTVGAWTPEQSSPLLDYHPRAIDYFNKVEADPDFSITFGTIGDPEKLAIHTFVDAWIDAGIWDKFPAIWIMFGNFEGTVKLNLKDPRDLDAAFRLTFPNGISQIDGQGLWFSGSVNEIADTHYKPATVHGVSQVGTMIVCLDNQTTNLRGLIGSYVNALSRWDMEFSGASGLTFAGHAFDTAAGALNHTFAGTGAQIGTHTITRRAGNDAESYQAGATTNTNTSSQLGALPNPNVWIGGINGLPGAGFSTATINFAALSPYGLTDAEVLAANAAIVQLNFDLGR